MTDLYIDHSEAEHETQRECDRTLDPDVEQDPTDDKGADGEAINDLGSGGPPSTINTRDGAEDHGQEERRRDPTLPGG
ncbi:hypothetical protein LBMAG38_09880 [Chloroflexota bacterium]|nr:hypothetical protein LBMAG38_09880 [Chloroflexota bacterium]